MSENIIQYLRITWHFLNGFRDTVQIIVLYSAILYTANGQTGNITRDCSDWQKWVADRSRNRVFRECNSFLVPTETVALPGNICGTVYLPGKYGKRVRFSRMLLQRGNVDLERELYDDC